MPLNNMFGLDKVDLSGGIGGLYAGILNRQAEQDNDLLLAMQALKNRQQGLESARYEADTPSFLEKSRAEAAIKAGEATPEYIAGKTNQTVGAGREALAKGDVALATKEGVIATTKALQEQSQRHMALEKELDGLTAGLNAVQNDGLAGLPVLQQYLNTLPEGSRVKQLVQSTPTEQLPKIITQLKSDLAIRQKQIQERMLATTQHMQKISEIQATGAYHIKVAEINERAKIAAARIQEAGNDQRAMTAGVQTLAKELVDATNVTKAAERLIQERQDNILLQNEYVDNKAIENNIKRSDVTPEQRAGWIKQRNAEFDAQKKVYEEEHKRAAKRLAKLRAISLMKPGEDKQSALLKFITSEIEGSPASEDKPLGTAANPIQLK